MEPVEAKAVDRISKTEILDPEIQKSWIRKSKILDPEIQKSEIWELWLQKMDPVWFRKYETDYRQIQSPASYSKKKNLITNCSEKISAKAKNWTLYPVRTKIPVNCNLQNCEFRIVIRKT